MEDERSERRRGQRPPRGAFAVVIRDAHGPTVEAMRPPRPRRGPGARRAVVECAAMSQRTPDRDAPARARPAGEQAPRSEVSVRCPLCDADHYRVRYDSTLIEADRPAAPLHLDLARVRALRPHRGVPLVRHRLHEPAAAPPLPCRTPTATSRTSATSRRRRGASRPSPRASTHIQPLRAERPPARRRLPRRHLHLARGGGRLRRRGRRALALGGPARRRARARTGAASASSRTRRCPRAPTTSSRCGTSSSTCPTRRAPCARCTRRSAGRRLRRHDDGRGGALPARRRPPLAVVHADAPRLLLAPHARRDCCAAAASRSSRSRATAGSCASPTPSRAWAPTAARRSASRAPSRARWPDAPWASISATSSPWSRASPRADDRARAVVRASS